MGSITPKDNIPQQDGEFKLQLPKIPPKTEETATKDAENKASISERMQSAWQSLKKPFQRRGKVIPNPPQKKQVPRPGTKPEPKVFTFTDKHAKASEKGEVWIEINQITFLYDPKSENDKNGISKINDFLKGFENYQQKTKYEENQEMKKKLFSILVDVNTLSKTCSPTFKESWKELKQKMGL